MDQEFREKLKEIMGDVLLCENEPMSRHTTFRVGGPAELFARPKRNQLPDILRLCKTYGVPYYILGNGSNLLVGDGGMDGVVIEMPADEREIRIEGSKITVEAGMMLSKTAHKAAEAGLSGMEFAAGIPGTLGGAVVMNAGAYGGEMKDIIEAAAVLDEDGNEKILTLEELELGYRTSSVQRLGYIVTSVVLRLSFGDTDAVFARMEELQKMRVEKQPLEYPSAGSTFKRPEGYFAGKLIMEAGLAGYAVGGAKVSEKHCGFVINTGNATAADIRQLMCHVIEKVEQVHKVTLEPEVKMIGNF